MTAVTVAIPVRNGGRLFARVLDALAGQTVEHELLVCDSSSTDGSDRLAAERGARVIAIHPREFGHGRTRNLLMREARGAYVALLTQDAEPADERWLERLLGLFELGDDVALGYGSYLPRPDAPTPVRIELHSWFAALSADASPRVERLSSEERLAPELGGLADAALVGSRGFFTDANACIARAAWERVPFRDVPYAEDRAIALDMLRAGYAKAYGPEAAVLHSHRYSTIEELRRAFDEWRGLHDVYGWREPASLSYVTGQLRGALANARRDALVAQQPPARRAATMADVTRHNVARLAGAVLGSRAGLLPAPVRRALSLEAREALPRVPPRRAHQRPVREDTS